MKTKKIEPLTLTHIFNEMQDMYAGLMNKMEILHEKLDALQPGDVSKMERTTEPDVEEISDTEYVTVNRDGVFVGGKPATRYRGEEMYNLAELPKYFVQLRALVEYEYGKEIVEYDAMSSETGGEYAAPGDPSPEHGGNAWIRCRFADDTYTPWVFNGSYSASRCASLCADLCGDLAQSDSSLRAGLFGSFCTNDVTDNA